MPNEIRQPSNVPVTSTKIDKSLLDAQVAHEQHVGTYLDRTELSIIDEEQQAVESLFDGLNRLGYQLPGCRRFCSRQRELSSGIKGVGRVQGKEVVTAGSWPMAMFNTEKPSIIDRISQFMGKAPKQEGNK
jgi:hypothetical protein